MYDRKQNNKGTVLDYIRKTENKTSKTLLMSNKNSWISADLSQLPDFAPAWPETGLTAFPSTYPFEGLSHLLSHKCLLIQSS